MQDLARTLDALRQQHQTSLLPRSKITAEFERQCDKWRGFRRLAFSYLTRLNSMKILTSNDLGVRLGNSCSAARAPPLSVNWDKRA